MEIERGTLVVVNGKFAIVTGHSLAAGVEFWELRSVFGVLKGAIGQMTPLCQIPEAEIDEDPEELLRKYIHKVVVSLAEQIADLKKQCTWLSENKMQR